MGSRIVVFAKAQANGMRRQGKTNAHSLYLAMGVDLGATFGMRNGYGFYWLFLIGCS